MPIYLREFLAAEKTISLETHGETLEVTFRVNALNTRFIETYYGKTWAENNPGKNRLDCQLEELILRWNLVDDNGKALAPSPELIAQLPLALKKQLGEAIWKAVEEPGDEEKKV